MIAWERSGGLIGQCGLIVAWCVMLAGCDVGGSAPNAGESPAPGTKRLVFIINGQDPYWETFHAGMKSAAADLKIADAGLRVAFEPNDGTARGQLEKLRQLASQSDVAAVSLSPVDASNQALADALRALRAKGIPVICVDGDMDRSRFEDARAYYMGTDNFEAGSALGTAMAALLRDRDKSAGSYVQFVGRTSAFNGQQRMNGVQAALTGFTEADRMADEFSRGQAQENVRRAIGNHPDLVALVGIYAYNGPAMVDVVQDRRRTDLVVGTMDAAAQSIAMMEQGKLDVLVAQNPYDMGQMTVKVLKAMIDDDQAVLASIFPPKADGQPTTIHTFGLRVVLPVGRGAGDNPAAAADYADNVEVMTVDQFRAWLSERNLPNS